MKEIIEKISSYNLFNYLFPGIIFVVTLKEISSFDLFQKNNFIGAFLYYFIGLVISRFGSLVVGEILRWKKLKFIKFTKYSDFVYASDKDLKIDLFSEINNMYRTIISMIVLLLMSYLMDIIVEHYSIPDRITLTFLLLGLIVLFIFSYKKQSAFIVQRVEARKKQKE